MKRITYLATYQVANGDTNTDKISVYARSINSGFLKATRLALRELPKDWEIVSVQFWDVA